AQTPRGRCLCSVQTQVQRSWSRKLPDSANNRARCLGCALYLFVDEAEAKFQIVWRRVKEGLPSLLPLARFRTQAEEFGVDLRQLSRRQPRLLGADTLGCLTRFLTIALVFQRLDDTALCIQQIPVRRKRSLEVSSCSPVIEFTQVHDPLRIGLHGRQLAWARCRQRG